jgi:hypothetical protein
MKPVRFCKANVFKITGIFFRHGFALFMAAAFLISCDYYNLALENFFGSPGGFAAAPGSGSGGKGAPESTVLWARTAEAGTADSYFTATAADGSGNVYAAGYQNGTGLFNYGNGVSAAGADSYGNAVLVKYDSSGLARWAKTAAGTDSSYFYAAAVDGSGNVYAAGAQIGTGTFNYGGSATATGASSSGNAVLVKYNAAGLAQWAKTAAGTIATEFYAAAVDGSGNVYAAGYQSGIETYNYGNGVTATGTYIGGNAVLVKYDSSGTAQWAKTAAGTDDSYFTAAAADGSGNVYAAGYQMDTGTFNYGGSATATGTSSSDNAVLVKYDSSGTAQWAKTVAVVGTSASDFNAVAVDGSGNVYAAGRQYDTLSYDYGNGVSAAGAYGSDYNAVLVKYNTAGLAQWAKTAEAGTTNSSGFNAAAADGSGNVYAAGNQTGTGPFDYGNGVNAAGTYSGGSNVVLVKYDSSGLARWAKTAVGGTAFSSFSAVTISGGGYVYAAGNQSGSFLDYGEGRTAAGPYSGGSNAVLVKYRQNE